MPVVILAGGQGVRLRPLTFALPKPLLPVGGEPILGHLLRQLRSQGFRRIYLALGYLSDVVLAYVNSRFKDIDIESIIERRPLGTAGPLRTIAERYQLSGPILVLNADILTDIRFDRLVAYQRRKRGQITVAVRPHRYQLPFGEIRFRGSRVVAVTEKPTLRFTISMGIYVVDRSIVDLIPRTGRFDMPTLIERAVSRKARVHGYQFTGRWQAVDRFGDLVAANRMRSR